MSELLEYIEQKKHDETRQGEALDLSLNESQFKNNKHFYIESYGCAMNFSDSEIVASILSKQGYGITTNIFDADLVLLNTCSIREKAEQTVRQRLTVINQIKKGKTGYAGGCFRLYG
jgi:tRNA-2-methylthio-N6-dimethylallyladenosine synthase